MAFVKQIGSTSTNHYYESILFTYTLCVGLFAIGLFLHGFFPIKHHNIPFATMNDVPKTVNNIKVNSNHLYKPVVRKVIFMIIDALRWDFVNDAHKFDVMPFSRGSIVNNSACLLQVKVNAPTVTMPRVKAMTSGSVSSFIDVALNFGKTAMTSDSVLLQVKNHGLNTVFYGDDTWLKLFPNMFERSEGTTSFFVSDYTEVDLNVTRHIYDELYIHNDWRLMILHYLGLDHIGHVYGPQSPLVKPKLDEMDEIIRQMATKVQEWNENGVPSLLIVCGDHGMKNSGGHGGATLEETLVPLVAFGSTCVTNSNDHFIQIDQVDIATTLAIMLGVPIPSSSIGSVSLNMVSNLPSANKLFILYYNAKRIFAHFEELSNYQTQSAYLNYLKAIHMHTEWLSKSHDSVGTIDAIIKQYNNALDEMKYLLVQSKIHYNVSIMTVAMILMSQILIIIFKSNIYNTFSLIRFSYWWISGVALWLSLTFIFSYEDNDTSFKIIDNQLAIIVFIAFTVNCFLCTKISRSSSTNIKWNYSSMISLLAIFLHSVSLSSSSFIEEEHQTWYFFLATFLMFQLFVYVRELHLFRSGGVKNNNFKIHIAKVVCLLVAHRVLRTLNSTGDKYADLPDISDWLRNRETNTEMSITLIIALILLIAIGFFSTDRKSRKITLIFHLIISSCIYLRHVSADAVKRPPFYPKSSGIHEVQIFWITVMGYLFYSFVRSYTFLAPNDSQRLYRRILYTNIQLCVMISALLHRPHNVILLPIQLITCAIIYDLLKSEKCNIVGVYISYCLGNVFYFYQGNSNSLATVDVAAGYVGLQSFILPITTLFLCINTFSAPILAYLIFLYGVVMKENNCIAHEKILSINRRYLILKFFPLTVYTIIMTIMRYHLFVWSVFSPKLLYEAMYLTVLFVVMFITQFLCLLTKNTNDC